MMSMFQRNRSFSFLCIFAILTTGAGLRAQAPATQPASPLRIVDLHGSATEMGTQHGQQLVEPIKLLHEKYLKVFLGSPTQRLLAIAAAKVFAQKLLPDHLTEENAMAAQTGLTADEAMLAQCFLDLTPMSACSTITLPANAAPDHIARFGRNLDFASLNLADKHTVVFIYRPGDGRYKFASRPLPCQHGSHSPRPSSDGNALHAALPHDSGKVQDGR